MGINPDKCNWVLNLIINGLPSIRSFFPNHNIISFGFKPYYKWITFNTVIKVKNEKTVKVLNLIINGLPSILYGMLN